MRSVGYNVWPGWCGVLRGWGGRWAGPAASLCCLYCPHSWWPATISPTTNCTLYRNTLTTPLPDIFPPEGSRGCEDCSDGDDSWWWWWWRGRPPVWLMKVSTTRQLQPRDLLGSQQCQLESLRDILSHVTGCQLRWPDRQTGVLTVKSVQWLLLGAPQTGWEGETWGWRPRPTGLEISDLPHLR